MIPCSWRERLGTWRWILRRQNKNWKGSIPNVRGSSTFHIDTYYTYRPYPPDSQLEKEINEKLHEIYQQLLQASVDRQESEKEARLKETLSNLSRIFPGKNNLFPSVVLWLTLFTGVRGRVVDLCKPTQRKYELAVAVVLGRNMDAVVVDEEKTAIDCIEVRCHHPLGSGTEGSHIVYA